MTDDDLDRDEDDKTDDDDGLDDDDDELMLESGPISVSDDVEIEATMQGAVLGTLPYMAPE